MHPDARRGLRAAWLGWGSERMRHLRGDRAMLGWREGTAQASKEAAVRPDGETSKISAFL